MALSNDAFHIFDGGLGQAVWLRVVWRWDFMLDVIFFAPFFEWAWELGPLSDLIIAGQPRLLNHSLNVLVTVLVDVVCNCLYWGKPYHLSTQRRCLQPPKLKRSRPTWAIGAPKALVEGSVTLGLAGWEGRHAWHSWQDAVTFLMSLFIPCQ